ncbi:zinc ribbon domain-containing protein [Streptomyces purpureus]|uniref:Zinc ribbon domain-containing protein n=1 Tax=Streptomyces purpureus TaxID=1951 RepID=A0A918HC77_9ACTN|nr:zinc ribbon domain-containing protein [Streptomyces purpureus]GGT50580.1 zinc ribbon domain-containing protein [Streptomyces purpureus]
MTRRTPGAANCSECGTRAEPGQSFCDSCGAVLGWTSEATPERPAPSAPESGRPTAPAPAAGGARPGRDAAVPPSTATGTSTAPAPATSAPAPERPGTPQASTASGAPAPAEPSPGEQPAPVPAHADDTAPTRPVPQAAPDDTVARARSLLVPVSEPEPRPAERPSVEPVLPGRPVASRPRVRAPGQEAGTEGGVPCPWCATPNRPDRHFCGRCAMPMSRAPEALGRPHRPWWRRLFGPGTGETPWAGDRPRLRRGFGRVANVVVGVLVLALLITAGLNTERAVNAVRDHFAKRAPVGPDSIKASRSFPGQAPQLAFDKLNNTWWGPGVAQSGDGEWIEARFDRPTRLLDLVITPGVSTRPDQLSRSALPHRVEAVVTTAEGKTVTHVLTLDQGAGGQRRAFRVGEVTAVRFVLRSAYGAAADKQVAIAEVEFFGPSNNRS